MGTSIFRNVLLCSDLSPASDRLLSCVSQLKGAGAQRVVLLHVIYATTPGFDDLLRVEAEPALKRQKEELERLGFEVLVETPLGFAAETIGDVAAKYCADCVVIGTHGKGVLKSGLLGSVSSRYLHLSKHATLLIPTRALTEPDIFRHILFPTDFSATSARAADYLKTLVKETKAKVTLLHVQDVVGDFDKSMLTQLHDELASLSGMEATIESVPGKAAETIVGEAKKGDASLIIMGSQGKSFLQVARIATVPVLFIPAPPPMPHAG